MPRALTRSDLVVASPQQVSTTLSGEAVILHLADGVYFGLNKVGARVWGMMQTPVALSAVAEGIVAEFETDLATAEADVLRIADELAAKGLIDLVAAPTP